MSRALKALLLLGVLAGAGAGVATYPAVGGQLYHLAMAAETRLYGLHKAVVDVGDSRLMTYQGGPANATDTLVMIHGYSADKDVWARFARHFTDRYRVLVVDLPGHGETAFDPALRYRITDQAERVIRAMDRLGIRQAHVIGNSMGGFIAARLAHDHPDRIRSATLMDAAGVRSPEPSDMDRLVSQGRNPFEVHDRAEFSDFYAMTMARAPWVPGVTLDYIAERYMAQRAQLAAIFKDIYHVGLLDDVLRDIRTPVLVMWGRQDRLLHVSMAGVWQRGLPNSRTVTYDDLGHMPMVEDPTRSARDVQRFLDSLTATPARNTP